jgi:hypothetical protein
MQASEPQHAEEIFPGGGKNFIRYALQRRVISAANRAVLGTSRARHGSQTSLRTRHLPTGRTRRS